MPGRHYLGITSYGAKHRLDNLVAIVDYNKFNLTTLNEGLPLDNLPSIKAFNWDSVEVIDGHSFEQHYRYLWNQVFKENHE